MIVSHRTSAGFTMTSQWLATLALAFFAATGNPVLPVSAAQGATSDASVRIDSSGRQRMLSQRMAKASCFVMIGVAPDAHSAEALQAADEFEAVLDGLLNGSSTYGLQAEADAQTVDLLRQVSGLWDSFGAAVRQLASGETYSVVVTQIIQNDLPVLQTMHKAVELITTNNPVPDARPTMAGTISVAGRQLMLSQKMAKEFCYILADISADRMRDALTDSVALFETTLRQLTRGDYDAGIIDPPNLAVISALSEVEAEWAAYRAVLTKVLNSEPVSHEELESAAQLANTVLARAHRVVGLYVAY